MRGAPLDSTSELSKRTRPTRRSHSSGSGAIVDYFSQDNATADAPVNLCARKVRIRGGNGAKRVSVATRMPPASGRARGPRRAKAAESPTRRGRSCDSRSVAMPISSTACSDKLSNESQQRARRVTARMVCTTCWAPRRENDRVERIRMPVSLWRDTDVSAQCLGPLTTKFTAVEIGGRRRNR